MAAGEFDVVTYALLKGQGGGGGGGSDIETNVTDTPAGQLLSNVVIDGVRYDLNNLTPGSMVFDTVYVDFENNKSILDAECIATFEERYGEDHTKWPTYPVYATLACETSDGYKWEEQGMLSISFDNADHKTIEFYQIAGGTSYTFLTDDETGETYYDGLIVPSTPKIEINNFDTEPIDIACCITVNGENYQLESIDGAPQLFVDIDTESPLISISEDALPIKSGYFFGMIYCTIDKAPDSQSFPAYIDLVEHEYLSIRLDQDESFCADLIYDADNQVYATSKPGFKLPYVTANLAQHLEETTGESIPVEEIHDLWIPKQRKFVKFAGGSASQYLHTVIFRKGSQDEEIVYTYYQIQYIENQTDGNWMKKLAATVYDAVMYDAEDTGTEYKGYINRCAEHNATIQQISWTGSNQIIINPQGSPFTLLDAYYENNEGKIELHFNNTSLTVTSEDVVAQFTREFDASVETDEPYWPYE